VLSISESCVEFSNDSAFVYTVKSEKPQEFDRKYVKAGLSDGINIEILEGLKMNDKVRGNEIIETKK
jgi:HlyD family secretion protein